MPTTEVPSQRQEEKKADRRGGGKTTNTSDTLGYRLFQGNFVGAKNTKAVRPEGAHGSRQNDLNLQLFFLRRSATTPRSAEPSSTKVDGSGVTVVSNVKLVKANAVVALLFAYSAK